MTSRIRLAGPSTVGPMAHRVAMPAGSIRRALERLIVRAVQPLPSPFRRRPVLTAGAAVIATLVTVGGRLVGAPSPAAAPAGDGSALSIFGGSTGGPSSVAASLPLAAGAGSLDIVDLFVKGTLVIVLLYVTLRVLRRFQAGGSTAGARIRVLESRTIGPKATIHLVAVGDRQLVVGLTPGRLVTLADLSGDELDGAPAELDLGREPVLTPPEDRSLPASLARRIANALK
jgi:flagellar protein FliO/FliZ